MIVESTDDIAEVVFKFGLKKKVIFDENDMLYLNIIYNNTYINAHSSNSNMSIYSLSSDFSFLPASEMVQHVFSISERIYDLKFSFWKQMEIGLRKPDRSLFFNMEQSHLTSFTTEADEFDNNFKRGI